MPSAGVGRGDEVHADVRTVGRLEVGEAEHAFPARELEHRRGALRFVVYAVEGTAGECRGLRDRPCGFHRGDRQGFVDRLVEEEALGAEGVPANASEDDDGEGDLASVHGEVSIGLVKGPANAPD